MRGVIVNLAVISNHRQELIYFIMIFYVSDWN